VLKGFVSCRALFQKSADPDSQRLAVDKLQTVCEGLGIPIPLHLWDQIIQQVDHNENHEIAFNEFCVLITIMFLIEPDHPALQDGDLRDFKETISIIVDAFIVFDKNQDGVLMKDEVLSAVKDDKDSPKRLAVSLFKDMDWDQNGNISFTEFVFACESWVGVGEEDEE